MFNFFRGVSLKRLVMQKLNAKIKEYQDRLDQNLIELNATKKSKLSVAWDNFFTERSNVFRDHNSNKAKIIDTHVTNLLNKII